MDSSRILIKERFESMAGDWKTVKSVLFEVMDLEPSLRKQFLNSPTIAPEVRAEVESLLSHEESARDFMSVSASGFASELTDEVPSTHLGQRIGVYETVSELGLGGMGVVYLGVRCDGKFEQKVAIKLLKREFNTARVRQIFEREKEILATLSHSNIASLLDSGTTDDGIPYLVMEYIEGEPIDVYCDTYNLSLEARLKLFNKVCDTVARAHRSLIVHRDLKPSNILVTADGNPKLLDFGISKLLDVETEESNSITQLGAMTPQYASPEQLKGEPVTTATDVYSLGVVLFKILTGTLPDGLRKESTTLPSEVARKLEKRSSVPHAALRGDLDNVVLKALRPEPDRRYQSIEQFSADIWRYIDNVPVLARPATVSYRVSKFVSRNKVQVVAGILVLAALVVGISVALSQAGAARGQARIAREQRDAAQRASERAEKTSKFMQSVLDFANPEWYGRGKGRTDVTVREAIDDAASRIDTELAEQIEVRADLHYTIGVVYMTQDQPARFHDHIQKSYDLSVQAFGEKHPKVARALYYLSLARHNSGSSIEDAEKFLREGVAIMRQTEPSNVNLPYMLQTLATWTASDDRKVRTQAHLDEAEGMIEEARGLFTTLYGKDSSITIGCEFTLADIVIKRGDLDRAERIIKDYQVKVASPPEVKDIFGYVWSFYYIGEIARLRGKRSDAEASYNQALELGRKNWGEDSTRYTRLLKWVSEAKSRL